MGRLAAEDFAAHASLETALHWHLTSNHFPPLPLSILPAALLVIELANAGEWDTRVDLPEGVTWRGETTAPVLACVEGWHLNAFLVEFD